MPGGFVVQEETRGELVGHGLISGSQPGTALLICREENPERIERSNKKSPWLNTKGISCTFPAGRLGRWWISVQQ